MGAPSKVPDEGEVKRWILEGKTYAWMVEEYKRKYNLEVAPTLFSNFRYRHGLPRRAARDEALIPWKVSTQHRWNYLLWALRTEARLRAGLKVMPGDLDRLNSLKSRIPEGRVIHYDPTTEQGWWLVPRREGVDLDMIREPEDRTGRPSRD